MEQSIITPTISEAVKFIQPNAGDVKGAWNLKKQKNKGKNLFSELFKSLSTALSSNQNHAKPIVSDSALKKGADDLKKGLHLSELPTPAGEKKKSPNTKIELAHEKICDSDDKQAKSKEPKKRQTISAADRVNYVKLEAPDLARDEKKQKVNSIKREYADIQTKVQENNDKSKRTIVIDLRKAAENAAKDLGNGGNASGQQPDIASAGKISGTKGEQTAYFGSGLGGLEVRSKSQGVENKSANLFSSDSVKTFQEILRNELVTNTKFIIRDGGNGEIQIELKPESLGRIKFKMSLENNRIEGKIFVENSNVKQMVEQSMQNLSQALMQEGFDSVNLQVALGGENRKEADTGGGYTHSGNRSIALENAVPAFDYLDIDERIINMIV